MSFWHDWLQQHGDAAGKATCPQRRQLLKLAAGGTALFAMPGIATASFAAGRHQRALSFVHTHTSEELSVVYKTGDHYVPQALAKITRLMRDFRSGDVHPIDPALLDLLWQTQSQLGSREPFQIISAYRSPKTNNTLRGRKAHTGVAKDSMHLRGQAIDVRLAGQSLTDVRDAALELRGGGVGFYPASDFVHIDTGRVRRW